jgi:magnesium-transporting ATPase (P-type)
LLNTSTSKGICYIETKNLDGETNLKHKQANKQTMEVSKTDEDVLNYFKEAVIECENPNEMLYRFEGTLIIRD